MSIEPGCTPSFYQYTEPLAPNPDINLRDAIVKAVKRRTISDIPIALLCSGGLDSTIVLNLVREHTEDYHVFTAPNGRDDIDGAYIPYLSLDSEKLTHLDMDIPFSDEHILAINEGPVDLGSVWPQYALSCAVHKEGYNVVLSGDGADELFGGYGRARKYDSQYSDIFHELVFYHLPRLDKLMMANTIELRCPFLSRDVIEGAMAVNYKQRTEKQFLKKIFGDIVPGTILDRQKEALKIPALRGDSLGRRLEMIQKFRDMEGI
jgi:asparagine synthase (glutamine-hydrolysing)